MLIGLANLGLGIVIFTFTYNGNFSMRAGLCATGLGAMSLLQVGVTVQFFLGYQEGRTPTGWPHTAIRRARLQGGRGKASPAQLWTVFPAETSPSMPVGYKAAMRARDYRHTDRD